MSNLDIKIGDETEQNIFKNPNNLMYDNYKLQQEIQYLHTFMRKLENKYEIQHKRTNTLLTWILICLLIYIVPDMIIKLFQFIILTNAL